LDRDFEGADEEKLANGVAAVIHIEITCSPMGSRNGSFPEKPARRHGRKRTAFGTREAPMPMRDHRQADDYLAQRKIVNCSEEGKKQTPRRWPNIGKYEL